MRQGWWTRVLGLLLLCAGCGGGEGPSGQGPGDDTPGQEYDLFIGDPDVIFGRGDAADGLGDWGRRTQPCSPDPCSEEDNQVCDEATGQCVCEDGACDIDGLCFLDGDPDPENPCRLCDLETAEDDWTLLEGEPCDDGDLCTYNDHCAAGLCAGAAVDCDDENHCTTDTCDPASGCGHEDNVNPCDDGNPCTEGDVCVEGICLGGSMNCDDGDLCTEDSCDLEVGCLYSPLSCDDGDACTEDACDPATGCAFVAVDCDDGDTCTSDGCDPGQGCVYIPVDCDDSDGCTSDGCDPGQGCVHIPVDCDDGDPCTEDACTPISGCLHAPVDCNDGDPCTDDVCVPDQGCAHSPTVCDDGDLCTVDGCEPIGGCYSLPLDCDDDDLCTEESCEPAMGCLYTQVSCDDGDPCSVDTCDPVLGCQHGATVEICDGLDNDCNGLVDDLPGPGPTIWFMETFASNGQGWSLGSTWAIGATAASTGQGYGGPDPATDHTDTGDNGVAGVVLGGNTSTALAGFRYLTSPAVNLAAATGDVHLQFRRWLNSDYTPYMVNIVEVYDGAVWQVIWETGGFPGVADSEWHKVNHDVTAYKNTAFRVRFGYEVASDGVYSVAGWNVDDVVISDHPDLDTPLFEDFGAPGIGWALDPTWDIGATATSTGQGYAGSDPALDHSPGWDNGVAGVVLGGLAPTALHDWYWLTSPARDVSGFASVYLRYWRWLNSDYAPFMTNRVEVWDGAAWVVLWETGGLPGVTDAAWALQVHDLTAYRNDALKVRFGYEIGASGVFSVASWNVDDVALIEGLPGCN